MKPRDHPGWGLVCICEIAYPDLLGACTTCQMRVVAKMNPANRQAIYAKYPPMALQIVVEPMPQRVPA